ISVDSARSTLAHVCDDHGYLLESEILKAIKAQVENSIASGKIDRHGFDRIFQFAKAKIQGKKNDTQVKRLIVQVMEDSGLNKVKTGWFSNWYATMKKEIGMA